MNGFGQAPIKEEGTSYNRHTGKNTKSPPYVHNATENAKRDLYWAGARVEDALDAKYIFTSYQRELLEQIKRDIDLIRTVL